MNFPNPRTSSLICGICAIFATFKLSAETLPKNLTWAHNLLAISHVSGAPPADPLPILSAVLDEFKKSPASPPDSLDKFVDALLACDDENVLVPSILNQVHIKFTTGGQYNLTGWKYGNFVERLNLISYLWATSKSLENTSPEKAAKYAKATIAFAAIDDYQFSWTALFAATKDKELFQRISGLTDQQISDLNSLLDHRYAEVKAFNDASDQGLREIDKVRDMAKPAMTVEAATSALAHFGEALEAGPDQEGYHWRVFTATWDLLNLARTSKSEEATVLISKRLEDWRDSGKYSPTEKRWINEALTTSETLSHREIFDFDILPNGTIKPRN